MILLFGGLEVEKRNYSRVYWNSEKDKKRCETLLKNDFGTVSDGLKSIIKTYYGWGLAANHPVNVRTENENN